MIYFTSDLHLEYKCVRRFNVGVDANGYHNSAGFCGAIWVRRSLCAEGYQ